MNCGHYDNGVKQLRLGPRVVSPRENLGSLGFRVWGLGFGVWGLGFGDWGLGFGVRVLCRMHAHLNIVGPELPRRVSEQGIEHAQALQFGGSAVDALDDSKGRVSGRVSQVTHVW